MTRVPLARRRRRAAKKKNEIDVEVREDLVVVKFCVDGEPVVRELEAKGIHLRTEAEKVQLVAAVRKGVLESLVASFTWFEEVRCDGEVTPRGTIPCDRKATHLVYFPNNAYLPRDATQRLCDRCTARERLAAGASRLVGRFLFGEQRAPVEPIVVVRFR